MLLELLLIYVNITGEHISWIGFLDDYLAICIIKNSSSNYLVLSRGTINTCDGIK